MKYTIRFWGRNVGAIGVVSPQFAEREADNPEAAIAALYNEFEHLSGPIVSGPDGAWRNWGQERIEA